jgi:uncharacterized BrkB/YihY/UPF0761 family membrane protein
MANRLGVSPLSEPVSHVRALRTVQPRPSVRRRLEDGRDIIVSAWRGFRDDDVPGAAAELSFRWLLAIFPLAIMTAAFAGFASGAIGIENPTDQLLAAAGDAMPDEAAATVRPQLERVLQGRDGGLLSLGLALTIYAASSGIRALSKALNLAYDITEARPLWRQYAVAIGLTIGVGTVAILAFLVLTSGRLLVEWLAHEAGMADVNRGPYETTGFPGDPGTGGTGRFGSDARAVCHRQ